MKRATGGTLEPMSDLRDGDAWRMAHEDVDMIVGVASGHKLAVERARFSLE